ncbi:MAG: acylneuraminate cytidylyltransferase family protein [Sphingobacteriales bacterium]|nr:MAG: acylneuraminate cytidylyltransferase family protein [Sphingobacteriales bacterium]
MIMKIIGIIPVRGGSKGVPGKNIKEIAGKPLISYAIEVAEKCDRLDEIWISSDDDKILAFAKGDKRIKAHKRSPELSSDTSPVTDTVAEILRISDSQSETKATEILLLQATAPIRTVEQVNEAIDLMYANEKANSVISVVAVDDSHPARMYWREDSLLMPIMPEFEQTRRQDIPKAYFRNGCIYIVRAEAFKQHHSVMVKPSIGYEMPYSQLLNIDEPRDFLIAEVLVKAWLRGEL